MKTQEFKIEVPKGFEIDKENSTFEKIVFKEVNSAMDRIYKYHNTTEKEFDELYKNIPNHVKAYEKECMVVAYYNKDWKPDFNNSSEKKWYPWFYIEDFRLDFCGSYVTASVVPARLLFKNENDLKEAVELHKDVFKESRRHEL
jgi:hypothetical protein